MKRTSSRRAFLAASVSAGLAGCSQLQPDSSGGTDATATSTDSTTSSSTETDTQTPANEHEYTDRGTVLDDFQDLSLWGTVQGEATPETADNYRGSQSVRIQNPAGDAAGIYKTFPDGLDLSNHDLSIAAKVEQPASAKLAVEIMAPSRGDHVVCRRYFPEGMDGWMKVDLGYTGLSGDPDLSNVQELRIVVLSDGKPINYAVDDLRKIPKATDNGKVVLSFDDTRASHYDVAFPELRDRGWQAMEAVIPDEVGANGALTTGQLREMRDAGWDMASHPQVGTPLPELSPDEQRRVVREAKEYLKVEGFRDGMEFMSIPYDSFDAATLEVVGEFHDYGFTFGASPNVVPPVSTRAVSRVYGRDVNGAARMINLAAKYQQLTVVSFSGIGKNRETSTEDFRHLLDIIENWDDKLEVITPSELQDIQPA